jgi:hypothetical protein
MWAIQRAQQRAFGSLAAVKQFAPNPQEVGAMHVCLRKPNVAALQSLMTLRHDKNHVAP